MYMEKYTLNRKYVILICCCVVCSVLLTTIYNLRRKVPFLSESESESESESTECPEDILTFRDNGNIATQLWSYASVWAMAKIDSRWHPYAPKSTLNRFKTIFTSSSITLHEYDTLSFTCQHRVYSQGGPLEEPGDRVLNFQYVPEMYAEAIFALKTELKKEFIFRKESIIYTDNVIEEGTHYMKQQGLFTNTFVAVLVSTRMKYNIEVYNYYMSSMNWFRKELKNPLFIIIELISSEDDKDIFQEKDIVKVTNKGYGYILNIIARCNNLILDEGAVAIFSALFAHGYVHVYNPGRLANMDSNLTNWMVYQTPKNN